MVVKNTAMDSKPVLELVIEVLPHNGNFQMVQDNVRLLIHMTHEKSIETWFRETESIVPNNCFES